MRSIEEKIDIPESRKDDFRREIMNYIGALTIDGKQFDYKTNERLHKALELKLFEDQKDTIKLTSLVSNVVDKETQEKIDVVKSRLIRELRLRRSKCDGRAELCGEHLRPRRREEITLLCLYDLAACVLIGFAHQRRQGTKASKRELMVLNIDSDHHRFRQIVRGKIKQNLPKYITAGEMIGKKGNDLSAFRCRRSTCRISATARKSSGGVGPGRRRSRPPLGPATQTKTATARPAISRAGTSSKSI